MSTTTRRRTALVGHPTIGTCLKCGAPTSSDPGYCDTCLLDPRYQPGSPALEAAFDKAVKESEAVMHAVCRKCGAQFVDLNGHGICDACLVERVNGAGELEFDDPDDGDLFPESAQQRLERIRGRLKEAHAAPLTHRITCAVCGIASQIPLTSPGDICGPCRASPAMTRAYVESVAEKNAARIVALADAFEAALAAESDEDRTRWARVEAAWHGVAEGRIARAAFDVRLSEALARGDGLTRIIAAWQEREQDSAECERVAAWAERASEEIEVARR